MLHWRAGLKQKDTKTGAPQKRDQSKKKTTPSTSKAELCEKRHPQDAAEASRKLVFKQLGKRKHEVFQQEDSVLECLADDKCESS